MPLRIHAARMDQEMSRSVLDIPVQVLDNGSVVVSTDGEHRDLHYNADGTRWQSRSIPNSSIGKTKLGKPANATAPHRTPTTKGEGVGSAADDDEDGFSDEGDNDDEEFPTDAQLVLALRAVYARHRHDLTFTPWALMQKTETELGGANLSSRRPVIRMTIALIKREEASAETVRGRHAGDKPTPPDFEDSARDNFAAGVATEFVVPHDGVQDVPFLAKSNVHKNVDAAAEIQSTGCDFAAQRETISRLTFSSMRCRRSMDQFPPTEGDATRQIELETDTAGTVDFTGVSGTRAGSVILETSVTAGGGAEAAATFVTSHTEPKKTLADEFRFGPCAVSDVRVEESVERATPAEAAPVEAPAGPAPPPTPGMADYSPLRAIDVVVQDDDDNRHPEEEIEGRDGGLWDYNGTDDDGELDDKEEEAVRQDSYVAPTGNTYDDITSSPPPHFRCVISPLSSLPPVLRCTATSPPHFFIADVPGFRRAQAVLFARLSLGCLVLGV